MTRTAIVVDLMVDLLKLAYLCEQMISVLRILNDISDVLVILKPKYCF